MKTCCPGIGHQQKLDAGPPDGTLKVHLYAQASRRHDRREPRTDRSGDRKLGQHLPGRVGLPRDGSEDGTKGLTENGSDELQSLLADIRTWDGEIRQTCLQRALQPIRNA